MSLPKLLHHDIYGTRVAVVEMDSNGGRYDENGVATTVVQELYADGHVMQWTRWTCSNGKVFKSARKKKMYLLELKQESNGVEGMKSTWEKMHQGKGWRVWSAEELKG